MSPPVMVHLYLCNGKVLPELEVSCMCLELCLLFIGTGIQRLGKVYQASYSITLDGTPTQSIQADLSNDILANFSNLLDDTHTIVLTTQMPVSQSQPQFFFDKALIFASHGPLAK